ncbi:disease resistance protein RML1B-like isoform X2 [Arachis ipaensis]|uniref:disease resistance protein RML1B-like isoform X2 n=1 Tax=Arachis ipaensis TaxID=130454 RepID=UPI000A2B1E41|nr:disease resistance protein RML1B-like isoform X2 [Arachis ipaensis]XP_025634354.1 disease resistance protein RML1B isoform X2 [Arachis hypogaea]
MASSSSSLLDAPRIKHDVFISFRGEDIRTSFLSHLRKELHHNHIDFFVDDEKLHPGDDISSTLIQAIEESSISLVIFSENYASSTWCLNELVKVIQCMKQDQRIVIPVFYNVVPSDVRHQNNSFKEAFDKHRHRLKGNMRKVQSWRFALMEASSLSGFHYPSKYQDESKFIEEIVNDISEKLSYIFSIESKCLVGIDDNFTSIESLLEIESVKVRIIGIWGMGGIGKTTIAEFLFDKYSSQYEGSCMLKNVREESQKFGVPYLCEKLISELLAGESLVLKGSSKARSAFIQRKLSRKKVFIVLDDMDTLEQFEHLATKWLGPGSRIIITTRDKHVLRKVHGIYEVQGLSFKNSLKLFCLNAFDKVYPETGYEEFSEIAVNYANGVPLALRVLGSFLYSKTIEEWESALGKLKIYPNIDIFNVLKLSYDGLDDLEKDIFLDIAFFFKGEDKDVVISFLESCGFFPAIGIGNLSRKALITISNRNTIEMHDLIGQMGREIVRQESIKDPGRRSRLSNHEDVYNVLNNNKGTDSVEGIMLDLSQIKRDLHLDADTFKRMPNIRFLKFYDSWRQKESANVHVSSTFDSFPKELRYLEWSGCPVKSLPPNICAEKLVKLSMPDSQVSKLWDGVQDLVNLKKINLRGCKQLVELPDFSRASNLEEICLIECVRLFELHPSILSIHKLENLSVWGCKALKSLKSNIHLKSLKKLDVRCCSSMKEFSVSSEELMSLNFNGTIIEMLQSSVGRLSKLVECDLSNVRLETLPNELCLLVSLEKLNLEGCKQLIELPHNMKALSRLQDLNITGCCSLGSLPELPPSLIHLSATNCRSLEKLFNIKTLFSLNLKSISFENCERLDEHSFLEYVHLTMMGVAIRDILADMLQYKIEPHADDDDTTFFPESNNQVFYPGSKVPPWFIYQTREASVTIDLPADQPLNQLVGFILCCVVYHIPSHIESPTTSRAFYSKRPPKIRCQYSGFGYSKQFAKTSRWNSDHVCIWFHAAHNRQWHGNNATFKFKAETLSEFKVETRCEDYTPWNKRIPYVWRVIEEWEVIGCGVYPIYASDILDVFQKVDPQFQFFKDRSSWERKSGIGRTDLQSVYTLEEVKTRMIHKMEADQKRFSSVSRICRISNNRTRMSMVSLKPKEVSQRLNEEENQVDQRNSSPLPWRLVTKMFKCLYGCC